MARRQLGAAVSLAAVLLAACGTSSAESPRHPSSPRSGRTSIATTPTSRPASVHPPTTTTPDPHGALPEDAPPGGAATTTTTTTSPAPSNAADMDTGHGVMHYTVGQAGTLWDPTDSVALATISVSAPTFSTSDAEGDTPQYGYFATFTVTMTDVAPSATGDDIEPDSDDFYVEEPDGQLYGNGSQANVQGGNGYEAELPNDLGTAPNGQSVDLLPGQSSTGTVTVDVPNEHAQLVYQGSADNLVDGSWAY